MISLQNRYLIDNRNCRLLKLNS